MRIVLFCHSLVSDWNHGNAHFLRGITFELGRRGHDVRIYEPADSWSRVNLLAEHGSAAERGFFASYPGLTSATYTLDTLSLDHALEGANLVIVHEWSAPELVRRIGEHRKGKDYLLLFHDTHHRMVTQPEEMERYELGSYDGVLAFGEVLRELYLRKGLAREVHTWHEAADTRVFAPRPDAEVTGDLVWVGNWGDEERTLELQEFLLDPVKELGFRAHVYGVRYPEHALARLSAAGVEYSGWLPNHEAPRAFASHLMTVHVPRRPYVEALVGVPTIRMFEALACGIPLVSAPWRDVEQLFTPGEDFLFAHDGKDMVRRLRSLKHEPALRKALGGRGLQTIRARHTCAHRVHELLELCKRLGLSAASHKVSPRDEGETACSP